MATLLQPRPLNTSHLVKIRDLLKKHGYSGVNYYDLGLRLGLLPPTLDVIKEENKGDASRCLRECLKAWLEQVDNVMSRGGPTYDTLIRALRKIGDNAVADGIERERILESPPSSPPSKRVPVQSTELDTSKLIDVLEVLEDHGYSGVSYYYLGLRLGLLPATLDVIKENNKGDVDGCLRKCLTAWLQQRDNVMRRGAPTYNTLIQALRKMGENAVADGIEGDLGGLIIPPTADPISTEDTPAAADRIADTQNPLTERKIEEWLKEGEVELEITRINMHGAPGAGKTCSQRLLLNEPPPDKLTDSTPIACRAAKATRISVGDENMKWKRVDESEMLNQLASDLKKAPNETKQERKPRKINEAQMSMVAPNHLSEPSLEEPPENKPTEKKPFNMEVIKDISNALETGNAKSLSTNWVYFIDSGGQPAYRELLPLFTRAAALNIITIDLTKGLDEKKCEFHYRISEDTFPINTELKFSNLGMICSAISSEAMSTSIEIPYISRMPEHSQYLILGTRADDKSVTKEKLGEMNKSLISLGLKNVIMNEPGKSVIFPVDTLLPPGSKREVASVDLCTAISNCKAEMTIKLPIRLFAFEISLQREARNKKQSFLTRKEVIEIGKSLRLDDKSDINKALEYLHNVTIILYYPAVLPNIIFVDPEPILNVLSRLIAITYIKLSNLDLIAKASNNERMRLKECGLFEEDLLKKIGQQQEIFDQDFESSHMIELLKHLHIIAEVKKKKEKEDDHHHIVENKEEKNEYFFPCALPSYEELNPAPTEIQPLLIAWEIDNSGTTSLAIPQGLFPLTIVHLLEQKDNVNFSPVGKNYYRYHDAMSLRVDKNYTIDVINRYTHIEIRFYDCKESCPQICELVTDAIKKSSKDLNVNGDHIFAFKCSMDEQCYCIVQEDKSSTRCTQCRSHCKVLQGGDDSYRCWFSNPQLSSPATGASPAQPHQYSTTGNPYSDGTGQLGIRDLNKVITVLNEAQFGPVKWNDLGLKLDLYQTTLNVITKGGGDANEHLRKTLEAWLRGQDNATSRTWQTLIDAVRETDGHAAADRIPEKLKSLYNIRL